MRAACLLVLAFASVPADACSPAHIDRLLAAPLPAKADREFDVGDVTSAEGGHWQVYGSGRPFRARQIVRTDYGEMGRTSLRLAIVAPGTYGLTRTRIHYDKPFTQPDFRIARVETTRFRFCGGELVRPPGQDDAAFAIHRREALEERAVFPAPEIRTYARDAGL